MDTGELGTSGQDSIDSPNPHSTAWLKPLCCPTRGAISHSYPISLASVSSAINRVLMVPSWWEPGSGVRETCAGLGTQ